MRTYPNSSSSKSIAGMIVFLIGVMSAMLTEAIAGTVLSLGRGYILGDTYTTPDDFAWLDIGYTWLKLTGFVTAPWLLSQINCRPLLLLTTLLMGASCGIAALTADLHLLILLRLVQGLAGGTLLVAGQTAIFEFYPDSKQPILQALFAVGAVVAPATIAPALQGWLLDSKSWPWIFFWITPISLFAAGLLVTVEAAQARRSIYRPLDWVGLLLISFSLFCFTYVFSQGSRWDWFEAPRIIWLSLSAILSLLSFIAHQLVMRDRGLIDFTPFRSNDYCFSFIVSFVAGAALFGSAFLIPAFAISVLAFPPTDAGFLLLPSGLLFVAALLIAAILVQFRNLPPIATVPFGILLFMISMWLLSGSTSESGRPDMMLAVLLRGFGLGFLFLSITLVAFSKLNDHNRAHGIGLFNAGRQLGGLMGVASLQTLIDHRVAANVSVLGLNITPGAPMVVERLTSTTAILVAKGMESASAGRAAISILGKTVAGQATILAFDTAFQVVALLFVVAAPILISIKIGLARFRRHTLDQGAD